MTDKEMAQEWVKNNTNESPNSFRGEELQEAYLAGLKAERPQWHKVADGDLPSEEGGWVCNQDGLPCYFDWSTEQWLDCEGTQIRTTEWCHMPHKE